MVGHFGVVDDPGGERQFGEVERFDLLVPEPVPSPVAQLKMAGRKRQRASTAKPAQPLAKKWQWGDQP